MKIDIKNLVHNFDENIADTLDTAGQIVRKHTDALDKCITEVRMLLTEEGDIEIQDLNYYVSYIPDLLYEVNTTLQQLAIKTDAAKMERKEVFNTAYHSCNSGTVQYKTSYAQQQCQEEQVIEDIYNRVYKEVEGKIEIATMLHGSLKKVLNYKTTECEITRTSKGNLSF